MGYSIGYGGQLPLIQPTDNASTLNAVASANDAYVRSLDKLADIPNQLKNIIQDNADARYSAALNKYSNNPEALANALANGEIDTSNVRAETLDKTQSRMKDIAANKSLNYLQGRTEKANDFMDNNGGLYLQAADKAHKGESISDILNTLGKNAPAEVLATLAGLNPQTQRNVDRNYGLQAAAVALRQRMYDNEIAGKKELFKLLHARHGYGSNLDPEDQNIVDQSLLDSTGTEINGLPVNVDVDKLVSSTIGWNGLAGILGADIKNNSGTTSFFTDPYTGTVYAPVTQQTNKQPTALTNAGKDVMGSTSDTRFIPDEARSLVK